MPSLELPPIFQALQLPLIALTVTFAIALGPQRQFLRILLTLPLLILLIWQSVYRTEGPWGTLYSMNITICCYPFAYIDRVLLSNPDKERWHAIPENRSKNEKHVTWKGKANGSAPAATGKKEKVDGPVSKEAKLMVPSGFLERLRWAAPLTLKTRLVGWSSQVKNVPMEVGEGYPRQRFIIRKTLRSLVYYVLKDVIYSYTASSPHGSWRDIEDVKPAFGFIGYSFWHRFWYTWVYIAWILVTMEFYNCVGSIVYVATGIATPRDCPGMFGNLTDMTSVRQAWSLAWHQQLRRITSTPATLITREVFRFPKGSFASKYSQLFIAFGISGMVHAVASMLCHRSFNDDYAMITFFAQAVIIMVEDHVIDFGKSLGFKDNTFWRCVGFVWAAFALGASNIVWAHGTLRHGQWVVDRERDLFGIGPKTFEARNATAWPVDGRL